MRWPIHSDLFWCVFAAFVALGGFSAQGQNLISNAQFTSPASGYGTGTGSANGTPFTTTYTVGGWTFSQNSGANSAYVSDAAFVGKSPVGGGNSVELSEGGTTPNVVAATATLTTPLVAGQAYTLTFEEYSHASQHSGIAIVVGSVFGAGARVVGSSSANTSAFVVTTVVFTATAADVANGGNVSFVLSVPSPGGAELNAAFGNVKLTAGVTPEPNSALGLAILSLGIVCTVERRRTKNAFLWLKNSLLSRPS